MALDACRRMEDDIGREKGRPGSYDYVVSQLRRLKEFTDQALSIALACKETSEITDYTLFSESGFPDQDYADEKTTMGE
jgi:hypothetical protein